MLKINSGLKGFLKKQALKSQSNILRVERAVRLQKTKLPYGLRDQ